MRKLTLKYILFLTIITLAYNSSFAQSEGTIKIESSQSIKQLIAKKRAYNKNLKYLKGYKIQLFYGSENAAIDIRDKFRTSFIDISSELKFHSPYWKVWVGSYKTRLEADRSLLEIKEGFPSAIIVPAKIKI